MGFVTKNDEPTTYREFTIRWAKRHLANLDRWLDGREFIATEAFTVADILMAHALDEIKDPKPHRTLPRVASYRERCFSRPAWKRTLESYLRGSRRADTAHGPHCSPRNAARVRGRSAAPRRVRVDPAAARRRATKTHVLVDWENVQPAEAECRALVPDATDVWLFHGPNQKNVGTGYASFGERATAVRIARTGKNALDFHLAFYMGYIAAKHPGSRLVVLSNDKGYGPMLDHAKELGFVASQSGFGVKVTRTPKKAPARKVAAKQTSAKTRLPHRPHAKPQRRRRRRPRNPPPRKPATTAAKAAPPTKTRRDAKKSFEQVLASLTNSPAAADRASTRSACVYRLARRCRGRRRRSSHAGPTGGGAEGHGGQQAERETSALSAQGGARRSLFASAAAAPPLRRASRRRRAARRRRRPGPAGSNRPVSGVAGCSTPRVYSAQISAPYCVASSSGAKRPKNSRRLSTSRSSMRCAWLLPAASTACGRSMITGPSAASRMLNSRQVAVDDAGAQHAHHLADQRGVVRARLLGREPTVVQARRGVALRVDHQLHQQHAVVEVVRLGHAHAGGGEAVERVDLGALPRRLLRLPAERVPLAIARAWRLFFTLRFSV